MAKEPLQMGIARALKASTALAEALGGPRIYDRPPSHHMVGGKRIDGPQFPYVTIGDDEVLDDSNTCDRAYEVYATVHVWSRAVGKREAKRIGDAVATVLNAPIELGGYVCTHSEFRSARYFIDPDGLTTHGVLTARYLLDEA